MVDKIISTTLIGAGAQYYSLLMHTCPMHLYPCLPCITCFTFFHLTRHVFSIVLTTVLPTYTVSLLNPHICEADGVGTHFSDRTKIYLSFSFGCLGATVRIFLGTGSERDAKMSETYLVLYSMIMCYASKPLP